MTYQDILKRVTPELDQILSQLERDLNQLRTGRADPSLVSDLKVSCFGQEFPLKQLAVISSLSGRDINIQPWDVSYVDAILSALSQTSLGSASLIDKTTVRLSLPSLTEEYRKTFLRTLSEKTEEQKVTIRRIREKAWKEIQEGERAGAIREDDKFRGKEELDKLVKKYNERIEELSEKKKKEVMD